MNLRTLKLRRYAAALREHPGKWAQYPGRYTDPCASLYALRRGNYGQNPSFPPDEFEFRLMDNSIQVRARCKVVTMTVSELSDDLQSDYQSDYVLR